MQSTTLAFVAISVCVYISCTFTTVYGKCSGKWAIHACYGGNGKRSGPPDTDTDSKLKERQYILRQLLLSEKLPQNIPTDSLFDTAPVLEDVESLYPDVAPSYNREQDIEKVKTLLGELLLRKRFRDSMAEEYEYRR
ncbi:uncharacterized protein LOC123551503 [Mercenaria mercenaria]|uniref:uncharacterized protein LOC123551503 n=1 Tax=Mercenaria mercenaria TaxID=6596 RepID=UPI001E1D9545|nr:uncharacterized protein LOC123551503 [Mercenaria mercenaria]